MKKLVVMTVLLALVLAGCGAQEVPEETAGVPSVGLANPWVSYDTLEEAEEAVEFALAVPESIGSFRAEAFRVMNGQLLEVRYRSGETEVVLRKQPGEGQDISGVYAEAEGEALEERENGWNLARRFRDGALLNIMDSGGYSWSLWAPEGCPEGCHADFLKAVCESAAPAA